MYQLMALIVAFIIVTFIFTIVVLAFAKVLDIIGFIIMTIFTFIFIKPIKRIFFAE